MIKILKLPLMSLAAACFAGCTTVAGPPPALSAAGPSTDLSQKGVAGQFVKAEEAAAAAPDDSTLATTMLRDGFALIQANCRDYFTSAGKQQTILLAAKDVIAATGTLATSVVAISGGGEKVVAGLALATGTALTGVDIYTKNYLFAAENVAEVAELVTKALAVHSTASLDNGPYRYSNGVVVLLDNQAICTDRYIAKLARQAIGSGEVVSKTEEEQPNTGEANDQGVREQLGQLLAMPGAVSEAQAAALWWLTKEHSDVEQQKHTIAPILQSLPSSTTPVAGGAIQSPWRLRASISSLLDKFSQESIGEFRGAIASAKAMDTSTGLDESGASPSTISVLENALSTKMAREPKRVSITVQ